MPKLYCFLPATGTCIPLYPFLEWVIYRPAARALPVVLYRLFETSPKPMPVQLASYSRTAIIDSQHELGSTVIVHFLSQNEVDEQTEEGIRTLHEVKRARVLTIGNLNVLGEMYRLAESGWNFRESSDCAKDITRPSSGLCGGRERQSSAITA
ncbi:hypothetical protein B0H14DRAFT_2604654 [Mycena olivaceomarginata]|nr:hypothetical protein B0H14DRAFT_2604654 [Mycena olivaceomarginata]